MKRAEDGNRLIVRLVERHNRRTRSTLTFDRPLVAAWTCNLMVNNETVLTPISNKIEVTIQPSDASS